MVNCVQCGKEIPKLKNKCVAVYNLRKYCSRDCFIQSRKKRV